ncbi:uncharacterized protein LOC103575295 [Microplitis demolitor]|uniref:uncharacterized protein LOC103575295 n=1 Tax=Microplitis demolitor TaxID=69319 RepID=UPI0004CCDAD6|nr:uncharacterized protein LOC103575295 [Microplitis demolitor]
MFGEMTNKHGIFCLVCLSLGIVVADIKNLTDAQENILSRQKRYLIFPRGSNVQLVYCLTIGAFAGKPDNVVVGMTAALAWELPSEVDKKITKLLHRRTRSVIFPKIEALLQSAGLDGRACVMRAICEAANRDSDKIGSGTFIQELLHVIFRLRNDGNNFDKSQDKIYDFTHQSKMNCAQEYPTCRHSIYELDF